MVSKTHEKPNHRRERGLMILETALLAPIAVVAFVGSLRVVEGVAANRALTRAVGEAILVNDLRPGVPSSPLTSTTCEYTTNISTDAPSATSLACGASACTSGPTSAHCASFLTADALTKALRSARARTVLSSVAIKITYSPATAPNMSIGNSLLANRLLRVEAIGTRVNSFGSNPKVVREERIG
jgi:hypothetical protein